uniref:Uncharacterized protein n=1 Tax=Cucumis sativus TaxID=3659 RepID=A0A0A0LXC6_CUCSA
MGSGSDTGCWNDRGDKLNNFFDFRWATSIVPCWCFPFVTQLRTSGDNSESANANKVIAAKSRDAVKPSKSKQYISSIKFG